MPDSGFNAYISVAPDGTVVTPTNLTPDGVIAAGDLATHADVNAAASAAIATAESDDQAYTDAAIAALDADVVHGAGIAVSGQYSVAVPPSALAPGATVSIDDGPYAELGWSSWSVVGYFLPSVICLLSYPEVTPSATPGDLTFTFTSIAPGAQNAQGTFFFFFIGTP